MKVEGIRNQLVHYKNNNKIGSVYFHPYLRVLVLNFITSINLI